MIVRVNLVSNFIELPPRIWGSRWSDPNLKYCVLCVGAPLVGALLDNCLKIKYGRAQNLPLRKYRRTKRCYHLIFWQGLIG